MSGPLFSLGRVSAFGAALLLSATALAVEAPSKATRTWMEPVEPGATVRVINPYGNVYSRFGGYGDEVEIQATSQRLERELPALTVTRRPIENGLEVVVGAPGSDGDRIETRDRTDLVVFLPRGLRLDVQTDTGMIEAKGLKSDLIASSIRGDIKLRGIEGGVRVKTAHGRISAALESGVTEEEQALTTETGEIEVHLWEDASVEARVATSGEISTDFSIEIEHRRLEEPGKHAIARIGRGGPALTLSSKRGAIRLLRLQRDFTNEKQLTRGNP